MNLCVIPARGGSKRIPRKNILPFCGTPIIAYSIKTAIASGCFDKIIVSTNDPEISAVANQYGAETPFVRPESLSGDFVGTGDVIVHAVSWARDNGLDVDHACCIYATAPLLEPRFISEAYQQLVDTPKAAFCFSATAFSAPIQRALRQNADGRAEMFNPDNYAVRSQDLEPAYHDAGQFYWGSADAWLSNAENGLNQPVMYLMPPHHVQDIDTPDDWVFAELMFRALQGLKT
jgi:pseudaminic acid cytidylyltransferase